MTKSQHPQSVSHQSVPQQLPTLIQAKNFIVSPLGLISACGLILLVAALLGKKPQGKLGKAYWGGAKERKNSQSKGRLQVANKGSKVGKTCLYINQPQRSQLTHYLATIDGIKRTLKQQGSSDAEIAQKIRHSQLTPARFHSVFSRLSSWDCGIWSGWHGEIFRGTQSLLAFGNRSRTVDRALRF
jgi:hypothetical protein